MIKDTYPCVLTVHLSNGGQYWSEIQGFKSEEEFFKWMHNLAFYGTKVNDWDAFLESSEITGVVQFKHIRNEKLD